ncbi:putative gata-type sexual development transcription factor [Phaeomoniella chlamydospora]|uniref:Putative gata-type sexual development transcription factor n=1 Tax=Phaeomoniella chlamydospora TaxID=158046 RepID=A0A0G2GXR3_PHACM|nr:putative gata-type sexual development transcription factor [Phaeomoniella chlamydospora]
MVPFYPSSGPLVQGHTESVKRHLDIYESEMAFNDVLDGSGRIFDFSKVFTQRLHQNQRSEISLDSLPSLQEVDDMVKHAHRLHDGLDRIRNSIIFQQQALADERSRAYQNKLYQEEVNGYHDEFKGGFAAGDSKKRRGKAAPPGRCHSCNRAETPEWRRGPDGARTLCNACGLHYAKLTRKNGANKGSIGGSNLRPKNDVAQ